MNTKRLLFGVSVTLFIIVLCVLDIIATIKIFEYFSVRELFHVIFVAFAVNGATILIIIITIMYASTKYQTIEYSSLP